MVVRPAPGGPDFLVLRAYGNWDFPKGQVEPGEEPLAAAVREVAEETGLRDLEFRWGYEFRETPPYGRGKVARYYLAQSRHGGVSLPVNPLLGRPEHHEFRWLAYDAARATVGGRLKPILDWAYSRVRSANGAP